MLYNEYLSITLRKVIKLWNMDAHYKGSPGSSAGKESTSNAGDPSSDSCEGNWLIISECNIAHGLIFNGGVWSHWYTFVKFYST